MPKGACSSHSAPLLPRTKTVSVRNLRESRYVAIDLLSGWWNGAEKELAPATNSARAEHENLLAAKRLEWPLEKEQPEQFLFHDVYLNELKLSFFSVEQPGRLVV